MDNKAQQKKCLTTRYEKISIFHLLPCKLIAINSSSLSNNAGKINYQWDDNSIFFNGLIMMVFIREDENSQTSR